MKRSLTLVLLALTFTLLTVSCATTAKTMAAADLSGMVTAVEGDSITVTPAGGGQATTVALVRATNISWPGGVPAEHTDIAKGHSVNVWLVPGTQNASRVNIGY
jgi:hypothetical protein